VYGCRSANLGIKLMNEIEMEAHDDFAAFCSLPWSSVACVDRDCIERPRQQYDADANVRPEITSVRSRKKKRRGGRSYPVSSRRSFVGPAELDDPLHQGTVGKFYTRFLMQVKTFDRCVLNFMGSVGMEMISTPVPSMITRHLSVISDGFDADEAKKEFTWFCTRKLSPDHQGPLKLLPGAALQAADPRQHTDSGILNTVQPRTVSQGHIVWMSEFSFVDSIVGQILIIIATIVGWIWNTGVLHFLLALTVLARLEEEVSVVHTFAVLKGGRKFGYQMKQDSYGQFLVPVVLGFVEAASGELTFRDPVTGEMSDTNIRYFQLILLFAAGVSMSILTFTMVARLRFMPTDGLTYEQVMARDGCIDCLLSGEDGTGFRDGDHREAPGVGPLQAHIFSDTDYDGTSIAAVSNNSPYHLSGNWVLAGKLKIKRNKEEPKEEPTEAVGFQRFFSTLSRGMKEPRRSLLNGRS